MQISFSDGETEAQQEYQLRRPASQPHWGRFISHQTLLGNTVAPSAELFVDAQKVLPGVSYCCVLIVICPSRKMSFV